MNILQKFYMSVNLSRRNKRIVLIFVLLLILIISIISGILIGAVKIGLSELIGIIYKNDSLDPNYQILYSVRIPRVFGGMLAGMSLAISGVILQAVMNNSLAGPNIIGVNSGAGLFALIIMIVFPGYYNLVPVGAFVGALAASLIIYTIALKTGASRLIIILAGVAVSGLLSAGIDMLTIIFPDSVIGASSFMIGGLAGITQTEIGFALIFIVIGAMSALLLSSHLNILSLGDEIALSLGLRVKLYRFLFIATASLLAGGAVSIVGLLGFVGLIVPHTARLIVGNDAKMLIPVSALLGGSFVILCDLLARVIFAPYEIPVGIIMSLLGGPFFIWLIIKKKRSNIYD